MIITSINIHPVQNGPGIYEWPLEFELTFLNGPVIHYVQQNTIKIYNEFDPFIFNIEENNVVTGKLHALDRSKESGRYFHLYPTGLPKNSNRNQLDVYVRAHGPFATFSLVVQ